MTPTSVTTFEGTPVLVPHFFWKVTYATFVMVTEREPYPNEKYADSDFYRLYPDNVFGVSFNKPRRKCRMVISVEELEEPI